MILVSEAEAGQKLVRFLSRRLGLPDSMLHRWIRQGQIRLNGRRAKSFTVVESGDEVRLPPFAMDMVVAGTREGDRPRAGTRSGEPGQGSGGKARTGTRPDKIEKGSGGKARVEVNAAVARELPPLAASFPDFLVFNKPAGLPVHGGTGHHRDLASLLAEHFADRPFMPTLAHRLDKDTSGLIVAALSYAALRRLHEALASRLLAKEYLAWAEGEWPGEGRAVLRHFLEKKLVNGREIVCAADCGQGRHRGGPGLAEGGPGGERSGPSMDDGGPDVVDEGLAGKEALTLVERIKVKAGASLLHLKILTGRTHQIRAQLAAAGHPVLGDLKYGARPPGGLFLHSARIIMPDGTILECLPPWSGIRAVGSLPAPIINKSFW